MSKATKGPWTFHECGGNFYIFAGEDGSDMVADNDDEGGSLPNDVVARMRGTGRGATEDEKKANARLIAAAPELLSSVKELRTALACAMNVIASCNDDLAVDAFTAMAKACGISDGIGVRANAAIEKTENSK